LSFLLFLASFFCSYCTTLACLPRWCNCFNLLFLFLLQFIHFNNKCLLLEPLKMMMTEKRTALDERPTRTEKYPNVNENIFLPNNSSVNDSWASSSRACVEPRAVVVGVWVRKRVRLMQCYSIDSIKKQHKNTLHWYIAIFFMLL
jgi:hypothetical protein